MTVFSQQTIFVAKDSLVCFTISQSKFILKQSFEVKELMQLDSICETQKYLCDSIRQNNEITSQACLKVVQNDAKIIETYQHVNESLEKQLKACQKEVRQQQTFKYIAIITGTVVSGYLGYQAIKR